MIKPSLPSQSLGLRVLDPAKVLPDGGLMKQWRRVLVAAEDVRAELRYAEQSGGDVSQGTHRP